MDEGKLCLNASVLEYLPGEVVRKLPKTQLDIYKKISIKRLLSMSVSGYPFRPNGESWLEEAMNYPIEDVDKKDFHYNNVSAYLVSVAVSQAIGEDLYSYLNRKLFEPLDISNPPYARCPDGYFYGASSMELSVHELSKIGFLLYNGEVYEGKRIVSEEYIKEATSVQQMNREGGYGYFIWKYRDGFSINGKWGQKCYILPRDKMMITFLSHIEEGSTDLKASMERNLFVGTNEKEEIL